MLPVVFLRIAYIEFSDAQAFNKALEMNGAEFGESALTVEEARPRDRDGASGGRGSRGSFGGGGRGRFSGGRGGRDGGRSGGFSGGRGGRGGGRGGFGGGARGGRGSTPYSG